MVKVRLVEVEGDPEEVKRVAYLFGRAPEQVSEPIAASERFEATQTVSHAHGASVTPELVLRVLTRRELHSNIKKVFKALLRAPNGMTSEELAKTVGIDRGQLAGVRGAFGRRLANTPGWPDGVDIIELRRDEKDRRRYYLPVAVRTALEKLDL